MIELRNISRTYDMEQPLTVLREVNLHIREKEFVGILGASGSGKSTLLHIMGLLDRPSTGSVLLDQKDTANMNDKRLAAIRGQAIGFVFQSFHLISHLSVGENVELPLFYQHVPIAERRRRATESLARVGLAERINHLPTQLSGGECQRTAIARALVSDPSLILADEPTGNLDSKTGGEIMELFGALNRQGRTVVLITHDRLIAEGLPRIITLKDGCMIGDSG